MNDHSMMAVRDRRLLTEFAQRVRHVVPNVAVWAFGSRARGTADSESDLDVCVVVPEITPEVRKIINRIAWEVGFEHDCTVVAPIILGRDDFENGPMSASTLVGNILRE